MLIEFVLLSNLLVAGVSTPVSMDTAPKSESSVTSSEEVKEVRATESTQTEHLPAADSEAKEAVETESPAVSKEDKKEGKVLHDAHCLSCHNTEVYTRENRIISGLDSLKTHIQRCATNTNVLWFEEEVEAVASYLNENFYHLK